jgi:phosphatidylserine/phosphatidylglycerophosphate/cardiolipin synthase-like enzyme
MTRRSTSSRSRKGEFLDLTPKQIQQVITLTVFLGLLCLGMMFLATGIDPLGLFATPTAGQVVVAPPPGSSPPTNTPPAGSDPGGQGDSWWRVFFTDPNRINNPNNLSGSVTEKLIAYIDAAQSTIHVASFEFNLTPVAEALIAAHRRGVEVRWVTDDEYGIEVDTEEGRGQFAMLEEAGIQIRDDGRSALMHNKFWISMGRPSGLARPMTVNDHFRNNNNVIVIESPELAAIYEREFEELWSGEFGPTSPSTVGQQSLLVARTPVQVYFASEDEAISHLIPLLESAQTSIYFMAFSYTHNGMAEAMLERAAAGVTVQGIFETRGSETEFSALPPLFCAGLPVRLDGNPGTFHHKVIIIDERIVITGSLNFSDNADNSNDENVIILTSKSIASQYLREFERRWAETVEPDPAAMNCK